MQGTQVCPSKTAPTVKLRQTPEVYCGRPSGWLTALFPGGAARPETPSHPLRGTGTPPQARTGPRAPRLGFPGQPSAGQRPERLLPGQAAPGPRPPAPRDPVSLIVKGQLFIFIAQGFFSFRVVFGGAAGVGRGGCVWGTRLPARTRSRPAAGCRRGTGTGNRERGGRRPTGARSGSWRETAVEGGKAEQRGRRGPARGEGRRAEGS